MYPGKRPYRATFTVSSGGKDEIGNSTGTTTLGSAWVSIDPLTARELFLAGGEQAKITHKVTLATPSFTIPVAAIMTVSGRVFAVEAPLSAPGSPEMTLMCSEKAL